MTAQAKADAMAAPEPTRAPLKLERALDLLIDADRAGLYVFALDALNAFGDSAWHSTVASLRGKGLEFLERPHPHQHQHGGTARFKEYRLAPASREKAHRLRDTYRRARGVMPATPEEGRRHD